MDTLTQRAWTRDEFFAWAERQNGRFEFDGVRPVAMTGGSNNHSLMLSNLHFAIRDRLRNGPFRILGPDGGLATASGGVRYPDGMITATVSIKGTDHMIPGVVAVFEIVSPSPGSIRTDRITKVREYAAVPGIRHYVMLESTSMGMTVLERQGDGDAWTARTLMAGETLELPGLGLSVPVAEFYEGVDTSEFEGDAS